MSLRTLFNHSTYILRTYLVVLRYEGQYYYAVTLTYLLTTGLVHHLPLDNCVIYIYLVQNTTEPDCFVQNQVEGNQPHLCAAVIKL